MTEPPPAVPAARRLPGPGLDGILVVAKPPGPTSHDVVAIVRRLSATKRVGHGGTLDPFAAGVLPIFLGRATRVVEYHLRDEKRYRATVCFGATSSTDDLDGELTPVPGPAPDRAAVEAGLAGLRGTIRQTPPAYSAIKIGGRRAYAIARGGATVVLPEREVTIHALELAEWDAADPERPIAIVDVTCSAGTYVRALARDLGASLGSGAYLGALVRLASGRFTLDQATELQAVRDAAASGPEGLRDLLLPLDTGLGDLPAVELTSDEVEAIRRGQHVRPAAGVGGTDDRPIRLCDASGRLVAIGRRNANRIRPDKVLLDPPGPVTMAQ
jgi:tRNA pseudouridine55 synthase